MNIFNITSPSSTTIVSTLLSLCIGSVGCSGANEIEPDWRLVDPLEITQIDHPDTKEEDLA